MKHLSSAFLGQNQWWKYVLLPIIAIIAGNIVAMIPMIIIVAIKAVQSGIDFTENPGALGDLTQLGLSQNLILAIQLVVFAASLILFLVLFQPFHKRNFKELVNGTGTVRWNRFFFSAFIWSVLMVAYLGVIYFTSPDNFEFHFNASAFIPLVVVALLLFPFQTTFEEVVFRWLPGSGFWHLVKEQMDSPYSTSYSFCINACSKSRSKRAWLLAYHAAIFNIWFVLWLSRHIGRWY
jgi:membrane protease YdiL (CAAX protease family)